MGARVYEFPWIDDFSAAKSHAIENALGEWIAFLDADEYFPAEEAEKSFGAVCRKLQNLNRNHPDINYMEGKRYLRMGEKAKAAELFEAALEEYVWQAIPQEARAVVKG